MTIQFDPNNNRVRIGDRYFPAEPFPRNDDGSPYGKGYTIPLGESDRCLSIAIGRGTYSDNYSLDSTDLIDVSAEMQIVEVGYDFGDSLRLVKTFDPECPWEQQERGFDVTGYVDDEGLSRIIIAAMSGEDPF